MLGIWFTLQFFGGFTTDLTGGGVAYWAHTGGFILGVLFTLPLFLRLGGRRFWHDHAYRPPHPEAVYAPSSVPTVRRRRK
jgi:membrane associated rhomboid family serine protease